MSRRIERGEKRLTRIQIERFKLAPAKRNLILEEIEQVRANEQDGQKSERQLWVRMGLAAALEAPTAPSKPGEMNELAEERPGRLNRRRQEHSEEARR